MLRIALLLLLFAPFAGGGRLSAADAPDIDVLYIERTPRLSFSETSYAAGLPAEGRLMTYLAHVKNWGDAPATVSYEWWLDGTLSTSGTVDVPAGKTVNVPFEWTWAPEDHTLEFRADPESVLAERSELNNRVSIRTNALLVGLWVEQGLYDYMHENQHRLNDGANGFEDWGQRMVRRWNEMMETAVFPVSPQGMLDRVALDKVVLVPNGKLPLNGGIPTNNPDNRDRTVDLMWGYPWNPADAEPGAFYGFRWNGPFFIDYGSMHEMNHARFQIDLYGLDENQQQQPAEGEPLHVQLTDGSGNLVAGTTLMPYIAWDVVYYNKWRDLMGAGPNIYDAYTAGVWNWKHHRRGKGNMNAPPDIGVFLNDLSDRTHVQFVDQNGIGLAGASVEVYRAAGGDGWYAKIFDDKPELTLTADAQGSVHLPRNPFGGSSPINHTYGVSNADVIFKVRYRDQLYFLFQEVSDFNMEFWKGNKEDAYLVRPIDLRDNPTKVPSTGWLASYFNGPNFETFVGSRSETAVEHDWGNAEPFAGVNPDGFSVYWQGNVTFNEGWKTFTLTSDGGLQLSIDGRLVFDQWANEGLKTWTPRLYTTSGVPYVVPGQPRVSTRHRVEVRYRSLTGPSRVAISWADAAPPSGAPVNAWRADYYTTSNLKGYLLSRLEAAIDHDYGEKGSPEPSLGPDNFSARWAGDWDFAGGVYNFNAASDDGMRVWIDGESLLDRWGSPVPKLTVQKRLAAGRHRVEVNYREVSGPANAQFSWEPVPPYGPGDVNGDTDVNVSDAVLTLRAVVGLEALGAEATGAADMDRSGQVEVTDAVLILQKIVRLDL